MTLVFQGRSIRQGQSKGHAMLCQGKSDMKKMPVLQVCRSREKTSEATAASCTAARPACPVRLSSPPVQSVPACQACAAGRPGIRIRSDQARQASRRASPLSAAGRRMLFATTSHFWPAARPLPWLALDGDVCVAANLMDCSLDDCCSWLPLLLPLLLLVHLH